MYLRPEVILKWSGPFFKIELRTLYFSPTQQTFLNVCWRRTFLPQKSENVRPHSNNSIDNATPSSGTSPLASYKEVPPPPGLIHVVINSPPLPTAPRSPHRAIHIMIFLSNPLNCYFLSARHSHPAFSAHLNVWNRLLTKKLFHISYPPLGNDLYILDFEGGNPKQMVQDVIIFLDHFMLS